MFKWSEVRNKLQCMKVSYRWACTRKQPQIIPGHKERESEIQPLVRWEKHLRNSLLVLNLSHFTQSVRKRSGAGGMGIKYSVQIHLFSQRYRASFFFKEPFSYTLSLSLCCIKCFPLGEIALSVVWVIYNLLHSFLWSFLLYRACAHIQSPSIVRIQ